MSFGAVRIMGRKCLRKFAYVCLPQAALLMAILVAAEAEKKRPVYRSPLDAAFSPDGGTLAVTDHTAGKLVLVDIEARSVRSELNLRGDPNGVSWSGDGRFVYVAETGAGTIAEVDIKREKVGRRFNVGPRPCAVALAPEKNLLLAANQGLSAVSLIDLNNGATIGRIGVVNSPGSIAVSPDESSALVANLLPSGDARKPDHGAVVSVLDLENRKNAGEIPLPGGTTNLRGMAISPDGHWAYAVHCVGRFTLPTDHLERGWVNTNALSILDLRKREHYVTVLLDRIGEGAANPWDIELSGDGAACWITLSGTHQVAQVDLKELHGAVAGKAGRKFLNMLQKSSVWRQIARNPDARAGLPTDLGALYEANLVERRELPGNGPRGLALSPDNQTLAVALYFSGEVAVMGSGSENKTAAIPVGTQPEPDRIRCGEQVFHDAGDCFQNWLSCATCHPGARADGLNWDLLNDGIGNPKNTHTLVLSAATPPAMSLGVRAGMEVASEKGFHFIQFQKVGRSDLEAVRSYLRSLRPEPSPYLKQDGTLPEKAARGKRLFEDPEVGCARCHPAPLFTDKQMYNVGTQHKLDRKGAFDTPSLREVWRTAPYLHDGSAATLREVFTVHNKDNKHGKTSHLSGGQLQALSEYVLSL